MNKKSKINRTYRTTRYVIYRETLIDFQEHFWAFIGASIGMGLIALLHYHWLSEKDLPFLIGSFGASCVLVYGVIGSPLAQPRNLVFGHIFSALVGVTIAKCIPDIIWLASALSVSLSIVLMQITKTLHPPGGATALIAVTGGSSITDLGYLYVLLPVTSGALILLFTALIFNNIPKNRKYPIKPVKLYQKKKKLG